MKYVVAQPDLISNSYFPALAAVELGFFNEEGIEAEIKMISPVPDAFVALRDGECHFVAGPAHAALWGFPRWHGAKILCALSQGMYWFLVVRKDLDIEPGDLNGLSGLTLGAAPGPDLGFRQMLISAGIDVKKENISIGLPPGGLIPGASFGVSAAQALIEGKIDGFWANGMGAEVAVTSGIAKKIIDVRRGDGPKEAFYFTQPSLTTSQQFLDKNPDVAAGAIRAIVKAQKALIENVNLAEVVGKKLFPEKEARLITKLIERDLPYYDANVKNEFIDGLVSFVTRAGLFEGASVGYSDIVATEFSDLWDG